MGLIKKINTARSKYLVQAADRDLVYSAGFQAHRYKPDDAIRKCTQAIRLTPDYPLAYLVLGNGLYANNRYEEAAVQYTTALELDPDLYPAHLHLAEIRHLLADQAAEEQHVEKAGRLYREALAGYRKAFSLQEKERSEYVSRMCKVLRELGKYDDIIQECEISLKEGPACWDLLVEFAGALLERKQYERAQSVYEQLLKEWPEEKDFLCALAISLQGQGRTDAALTAYRKAEANIEAGKLLLAADREGEALEEFQVSIQRDQQPVFTDDDGNIQYNELSVYNDLAYYHAGMILLNRGMKEAAVMHLVKFLELLDCKAPEFFTAVQGRKEAYEKYLAEAKYVVETQILKEASAEKQESVPI